MRSRAASRTTRTSPCLRRKLEISSAGGSAAITGVASSRKPAVTLPIARRVIVPRSPFARETSAKFGRFSIGNVDASRHGPRVLFLGMLRTCGRGPTMSVLGGIADFVRSHDDVAFCPWLRENVRAPKARRIVFSIVLSQRPWPALLFFKLIEVETKFPFANSISSFSRSQDPQRTFTKGDRPSATSPIEISGRCRAQEDRRRNRGGASRTDPSNKGDRAYRASAIYARFRTFCATYCPTLRPISSPVRIENLLWKPAQMRASETSLVMAHRLVQRWV